MGCVSEDPVRADAAAPGHTHGHGHHDHDHDHGGSLVARLRHTVSHLVGGHSHDISDQIDDALEADAAGRRALWWSLAILGLTALAQAALVVVTGSVALLGDTLHNVGDALTAVPLLVAFRLAARPATKRFTFGLGRAEDLAGVAVLVAIAVSAVVAGYEAVERLVHPRDIAHPLVLAGAGLIGFVGNEVVARWRIRVGRRIGSTALVADGLHARTDGFTSLAVVVVALGALAGWRIVDPLVGLAIAVAIAGVLRSAVAQVGVRLLDGIDPEVGDRIRRIAAATPGVDGVDAVRARWVGHRMDVELYVAVGDVGLRDAEAVTAHVEDHLRGLVPHLRTARVRAVTSARPAAAAAG